MRRSYCRSRCILSSGTKLEAIRFFSRQVAIHSASFTSLFFAGGLFDEVGIDQMEFGGILKHPLYRHPADARAFHGAFLNAFRFHQIAEHDKFFSQNTEFLLNFLSVIAQNTAKKCYLCARQDRRLFFSWVNYFIGTSSLLFNNLRGWGNPQTSFLPQR